MSELVRVLMRRDGLTLEEAEEQVAEARRMVAAGAAAGHFRIAGDRVRVPLPAPVEEPRPARGGDLGRLTQMGWGEASILLFGGLVAHQLALMKSAALVDSASWVSPMELNDELAAMTDRFTVQTVAMRPNAGLFSDVPESLSSISGPPAGC